MPPNFNFFGSHANNRRRAAFLSKTLTLTLLRLSRPSVEGLVVQDMSGDITDIDLDSVIDRLLEGELSPGSVT